jgi:hypothetical protein
MSLYGRLCSGGAFLHRDRSRPSSDLGNAVKAQVWTALISMLLLRYLQLSSRFGWSLSNLVALLRMNPFIHRDLMAWLDKPFAIRHAARPSGSSSGLFGLRLILDSIGRHHLENRAATAPNPRQIRGAFSNFGRLGQQ